MRCVLIVVGVMAAATAAARAEAGSELTSPAPILTELLSRIRPVLRRYYPNAKSQVRGDVLQFEQDTRQFFIHIPLKTGEWQDAQEISGPNRRGILCTIELRGGRYDGQAVLPQTSDERYFRTLVMAEASPDQSMYLYVHLSYPDTVDRQFLGEFHEAVKSTWRKR